MDFELLLNTLLEFKKQGIIVVDTNGDIVKLIDNEEKIFEADAKYAQGKNILDLFVDTTREESIIYKVLDNEESVVNHIQVFGTINGSRNTAVTSAFPLYKEGALIGAFEIFEYINDGKTISDRIVGDVGKDDEYMANGTKFTLSDIIGMHESVKTLKKKIYRIADSKSSVLIYGETGTGKELVAQSIHNASFKRRRKPFVAQNCSAIPSSLLESILFGTSAGSFTGAIEKPGLFELANGGTLFLDEINSMDIDLQAKLLRVLQDGVIRRVGGKKTIVTDVRIIASTNTPPLDDVSEGRIREDLYYRLNVIPFNILPLRGRKSDMKMLIDYFIDHYNDTLMKNVKRVSQECMVLFMEYDWPGNVRELKYAVEYAMNFVERNEIRFDDLPDSIKKRSESKSDGVESLEKQSATRPLNDVIAEIETNMIVSAMNKVGGNKSKAARLLDIPRQSLNNKIKKYNISGNFKADK